MITELVANGDVWTSMSEERRERIREWLRDVGLDPRLIYAVRLIGEGCIEIERYCPDDEGRFRVHPMDSRRIWTVRETVLLDRFPEAWPA